MAIDTTSSRTRRAILFGALGAAAASVAAAVGRASPVSAANGDAILAGDLTKATAVTHISATGAGALFGSSDTGTGVNGQSDSSPGILGSSGTGDGVYGQSGTGNGVTGTSSHLNGVQGETGSSGASGVYGDGTGNGGYGVAGRTTAGPLVNNVGAAGVLGDNTANGVGVWARSAHGIALYADPVHPGAVALKTNGVAQFKRSGFLTIKAGVANVTKTGIRVDPGTLVLATLQQNCAGVWI